LIRAGDPTPTARETARRGHLSLRVIFKHFPTLSALRQAAIGEIEVRSQEFYAEPVDYEVALERRIEKFVQRQTAMFEVVAPFRRAALMVEGIDPVVAAVMRRVR